MRAIHHNLEFIGNLSKAHVAVHFVTQINLNKVKHAKCKTDVQLRAIHHNL